MVKEFIYLIGGLVSALLVSFLVLFMGAYNNIYISDGVKGAIWAAYVTLVIFCFILGEFNIFNWTSNTWVNYFVTSYIFGTFGFLLFGINSLDKKDKL